MIKVTIKGAIAVFACGEKCNRASIYRYATLKRNIYVLYSNDLLMLQENKTAIIQLKLQLKKENRRSQWAKSKRKSYSPRQKSTSTTKSALKVARWRQRKQQHKATNAAYMREYRKRKQPVPVPSAPASPYTFPNRMAKTRYAYIISFGAIFPFVN